MPTRRKRTTVALAVLKLTPEDLWFATQALERALLTYTPEENLERDAVLGVRRRVERVWDSLAVGSNGGEVIGK